MKRKKPLLTTLAVLGSVLLIVAAFSLIWGTVRGGERFSGGKDTPYPYTWIQRKDGSIDLMLDGKAAAGYHWEVSERGSGIVSLTETETKNETTTFHLTPMGEGITTLTFTLARDDDRVAEAAFQGEILETEQGLTLTFASHTVRPLPGKVSGGEDTSHPFTANTNKDGEFVIHIQDDARSNGWTADTSDETVVSIRGVMYVADGVELYLGHGAAGDAEVTVSIPAEMTQLVFTVSSDGGVLTLNGSRSQEYTPVETEQPVDSLELEEDITMIVTGGNSYEH